MTIMQEAPSVICEEVPAVTVPPFGLNAGFRAARLADTSYATGKALSGLKRARPRYYRGFDTDGIDGYREFREMEDIENISDFLTELE